MNEKQIEFLKSIGINPDSELDLLEDSVADYLQLFGIDSNDELTDIGLMCESILDYISSV